MYRKSQIERGIRSPVLIGREMNRLYHRRAYSRESNTEGVQVFDCDWDNMIILDACRYDMFERRNTIPGTLESRISAGSSTVEFLHANVKGRDLSDTVYVTANPQLYRNQDDIDPQFHDVVQVWQDSGWDEEERTVLPETTTQYAREAAEKYPDKRLLIHYIQPHYPFISTDTDFDKQNLHDTNNDNPDFWYEILTDKLSIDIGNLWNAYDQNLDHALESVSNLLDDLPGKTVVTSDHGNMLGERAFPIPVREWGHPNSVYTGELVKVPWLTVKNGERKTIVAEESVTDTEQVNDGVVEERLKNLGYAE